MSVPTTDDEVAAKIAEIHGGSPMGVTLLGLYRCRRAQGDSVLDAYTAILWASLPDVTLVRLGTPDAMREIEKRKAMVKP